MQQLRTKPSPAVEALGALLVAHSTLTRELSKQLEADHGLTLMDWEVLMLLSKADGHEMRRVDLARQVRLSPSGITRMLDRLEAAGLVEKGSCPEDARVTYAVLTEAGMRKLEDSYPRHFENIDQLLGAQLDPKEIASLSEMLAKLAEGDTDCTPGT
jgi:MarR family transcriptional regulator, 2-MHQ and catechol-resistance regulon repressor